MGENNEYHKNLPIIENCQLIAICMVTKIKAEFFCKFELIIITMRYIRSPFKIKISGCRRGSADKTSKYSSGNPYSALKHL